MRNKPQQVEAVLLAGVYALAGMLWIFYSDQYSIRHAEDAYELTRFQTYKGWAYIGVTTLLVYGLIRLVQLHQNRSREKSQRLERVQKVLSDVSQAIIRSPEIAGLLKSVCQIGIKAGGYSMVWIGRVDERRDKLVALETAGAGDARFNDLDLTGDEGSHCPVTAALLRGERYFSADIKTTDCGADWCRAAVKQGLGSVLALPIQIYGELGGAIAFCSNESDAFAPLEIQFLENLAADLGRAITHAEDERRWILALEGAGHCVWDATPAANKVFFSRRWKERLGYAEQEIGNSMSEWTSRIHPDDAELCRNQIERLDNNESQTFSAEYRLRCKDGTYKWIQAQGMVFARDAAGKPLRIVGTDLDITDRKNRERAFLDAQKVARIGSYIYDARFDAWTCTQIMDEILGVGPSSRKDAESWLALVRPDQREDMRVYLHEALHSTRSFDKAYPIIRQKDGIERWVHGLGEVELDEQGAPLRMVGSIQDITERRRSQLILHGRLKLSQLAQEGKIEELLQAALDMAEEATGSHIGFFHFVDTDQENLQLQAWSSNTRAHMCKAGDYERHYPVSKAGIWADCLRKRTPVIHNDYAKAESRRGLPEGHAEIRRELTVPVVRQGTVVAIAGVGNKFTPYTDGDAVVVQELAGFVMDLVSNIEAERSLRQSEAQLRKTSETLQAAVDNLTQLNTELERFAFIASHDLQEPLRNITTYTQLIDRKFRDRIGPEGKEYFDLVVGGAKRMYALINDLLTYSRTGASIRPAHLISSSQSCRSAIENLYSAIKECGAEIKIDDLPSVVADEVQMMQLFQNLISNAIKFRHPARPIQIEVGARRAGDFWEFRVADNGIGFDPNEQDVFELFRRVHANRGYPGTGVGLAICKRIVLRNGGRIWVESALGKGSVFTFTLPTSQEEAP
ncbi:MAG: GAF domain-containing protein [Rhodospirillales bacterium]|nr:GAF domain-containing protein [Rhodospirillales bacterium]